MHHPTDRITHTTAFVTTVVEHWLEREIAQWVHPMNFLKCVQHPVFPGGSIRKEMFLFNDALNTFNLRLYGVRHMVKDHSDSERENPLHQSIDRMVHNTAIVIPVVDHWLEWEIAQWVHHEGSVQWSITPRADALTMELHLAPISWIAQPVAM